MPFNVEQVWEVTKGDLGESRTPEPDTRLLGDVAHIISPPLLLSH